MSLSNALRRTCQKNNVALYNLSEFKYPYDFILSNEKKKIFKKIRKYDNI